MVKRQLYQCLHPKVRGDRIYCSKGYRLRNGFKDGTIPCRCLERGDPLICSICQDCGDYFEIGPPLKREDRGWHNGTKTIHIHQP